MLSLANCFRDGNFAFGRVFYSHKASTSAIKVHGNFTVESFLLNSSEVGDGEGLNRLLQVCLRHAIDLRNCECSYLRFLGRTLNTILAPTWTVAYGRVQHNFLELFAFTEVLFNTYGFLVVTNRLFAVLACCIGVLDAMRVWFIEGITPDWVFGLSHFRCITDGNLVQLL